jgi:exodeoxyribonuclease VII large subunit
MGEVPRINVVELSVTELAAALRRTVEDAYGYVRVRGEISGYRGPHSSGHCYFALKDEGARIEAVIWKSAFARLRVKPEEGLEMIATGRLTTYPGRSTYQIVIEALEPSGIGALMALLEQRKRKLAAEGLFDPSRKQQLPFLPALIGVVTSPTGAVIRDILHRLADRFARPVLVWPVRVQGEGAAEQVAGAIRGFNALPEGGPVGRPDVIIVARGGGSLEDLWTFNEEIVVRAVAESRIALISAVGHETDVTLIDFAADRRAPTPSAAAEIAVPVRLELVANVDALARRGLACWQRGLELRRATLRACSRAWPNPDALLAAPRQRLDAAAERLPRALRANAQIHVTQFSRIAARLTPQILRTRLVRDGERARSLAERAERAATLLAERRRERLEALAARLAFALRTNREAHRARLGRDQERLETLLARARVAAIAVIERRAGAAGRAGQGLRAARPFAERRRERLGTLAARLHVALRTNREAHCARLGRDRERLETLFARARIATTALVDRRAAAADRAGQVLAALSYHGVLARGFALVRDPAGRPLRSAASVSPRMRLDIEFADGRVAAVADRASAQWPGGVAAPSRPAPLPTRARTGRAGGDPGQGSLFDP